MALTDESTGGMVMPVTPMYGGGQSGFGNGFGDGGWWILLLFILLGNGRWGNGFAGGSGGTGDLYPWMNQAEITSDGFRDQMLNTTINGIQNSVTSGFGDVQTALCNGFAGVNATINGAQNALASQMYGNTIADLERSFATQTAITAGLTSIQSQLAQCCCDNRAGLADLRYTVATEACADRQAVNDALRDVLEANTASTQRILDQMCADKIDAKNEKIADLERQLTMANLAASQTAQTAQIRAGQVAEIDAMYNRLRDCPVPTMPVYGSQPIFTCPQNNSCGCGGNF